MFSPSYLDFFKDLASNNHTEWFNANKKTYEKAVKEPFEAFVRKVINEVHHLTPEIGIEPKDAIFRLNKDIRFSADKSPYKTEMSAVISKSGKKSNPCPGLYLSFGAEKAVIAAGLKMLDKEQLHGVRHHIAHHLDTFNNIIEDEAFKAAFGEVTGEKVKRLPAEFKAFADQQPILYHTTFLLQAEFPAEVILKPDFFQELIELYKLTLPFAMFLQQPIAS